MIESFEVKFAQMERRVEILEAECFEKDIVIHELRQEVAAQKSNNEELRQRLNAMDRGQEKRQHPTVRGRQAILIGNAAVRHNERWDLLHIRFFTCGECDHWLFDSCLNFCCKRQRKSQLMASR